MYDLWYVDNSDLQVSWGSRVECHGSDTLWHVVPPVSKCGLWTLKKACAVWGSGTFGKRMKFWWVKTGCALHPLKINGWNLKITQLKREIIWSKHPVLGFKMLVFGGCREWGNQSPHHDHVLRAGQKSISRLFSCDIPISSSISRVSRKWK